MSNPVDSLCKCFLISLINPDLAAPSISPAATSLSQDSDPWTNDFPLSSPCDGNDNNCQRPLGFPGSGLEPFFARPDCFSRHYCLLIC